MCAVQRSKGHVGNTTVSYISSPKSDGEICFFYVLHAQALRFRTVTAFLPIAMKTSTCSHQ